MSAPIAGLLTSEPMRPVRRSEYDQLVAAGAFEDEQIELLEGRLVEMSQQGIRHAYVVQKPNTSAGAGGRRRRRGAAAVGDGRWPATSDRR